MANPLDKAIEITFNLKGKEPRSMRYYFSFKDYGKETIIKDCIQFLEIVLKNWGIK